MDLASRLDSINWSPAVKSVWGKTNSYEIRAARHQADMDEPRPQWLSLVRHLMDASMVADHLFDQLPVLIQHDITDSLGFGLDGARSVVTFLAGIHDVGKAYFGFSRQVLHGDVPMPELVERMETQGFRFPSLRPKHKVFHHSTVGDVEIAKYLSGLVEDGHGVPRRVDSFASVAGAHHGSGPERAAVSACKQHLLSYEANCPLWGEARGEILAGMVHALDIEEQLPKWVEQWTPGATLMLIEGLIIQADWIASDTDLFPLDADELSTRDRVDEAFERLTLPPAWTPLDPPQEAFSDMGTRFPALASAQPIAPNALQSAVLRAAHAMQEPSLMVVEAPMGGGKTEAALLAAEVLDAKFGGGGVFFGLPTMATANPMFSRVAAWLEQVPVTAPAAIVLSHSKAGLNDDFRGLRQQVHSGTRLSGVTVDSWFLQRKRGILANAVVATIDQYLFMGLRAKHVVLRHLGLAGKVVILDEVHAADSYMRVYLNQVLTWLGAYGTPVVMLSATLPPATRQEFVDAYLRGRNGRASSEPALVTDAAYPLITTVGSSIQSYQVPPSGESTTVQLAQLAVESDGSVTDLLGDKLADGGVAGVIVNTVRRAQELYDECVEAFGADTVRLLHSRFLAPDRARKEKELVGLLGRDGTNRPQKLIVVGTQVLEQSLDIDFDLLITDLAPIDLVLQRMGRLHRHRRERPYGLTKASCFVMGTGTWDGAKPPEVDRASAHIYGRAALLRAAAVLRDLPKGEVVLPRAIPTLVAAAYDPLLPAPCGWEVEWSEADDAQQEATAHKTSKARTFLLEGPRRAGNMTDFTSAPAGDPENDDPGRCAVRDSEDSLEVIMLVHGADGLLRVPQSDGSGTVVPFALADSRRDRDIARQAAAATVTLPQALSGEWIVDKVIAELEIPTGALKNVYDGWQSSVWLKGRLVLFVDDSLDARLAGMFVHYDYEKGLQVTKDDQSAEELPTRHAASEIGEA